MRTTSTPYQPNITFLDLHRESKKDRSMVSHRRVWGGFITDGVESTTREDADPESKLNAHLVRAKKRQKKSGVRAWG